MAMETNKILLVFMEVLKHCVLITDQLLVLDLGNWVHTAQEDGVSRVKDELLMQHG